MMASIKFDSDNLSVIEDIVFIFIFYWIVTLFETEYTSI